MFTSDVKKTGTQQVSKSTADLLKDFSDKVDESLRNKMKKQGMTADEIESELADDKKNPAYMKVIEKNALIAQEIVTLRIEIYKQLKPIFGKEKAKRLIDSLDEMHLPPFLTSVLNKLKVAISLNQATEANLKQILPCLFIEENSVDREDEIGSTPNLQTPEKISSYPSLRRSPSSNMSSSSSSPSPQKSDSPSEQGSAISNRKKL